MDRIAMSSSAVRTKVALRAGALPLLAAALSAQQPVAPTPDAVGNPRGENAAGYNIVNSLETGYRFSSVDGNLGKYRSDVNFGNGPRLLSSQLGVHSLDGKGGLFDEIVLTTLGLGNDPYQSALLRIQKNAWYRYDMQWRLNDYYNPALTVAYGEHLMDTERRMQDHDLTLFPQSRFKLRLGYARNVQDGPALTTVQLTTAQEFDTQGDEFPLFANVRREWNEYRLGGDVTLAGFKLTWMRRWNYFKEDTPHFLGQASAGNNPADLNTLTSFNRSQPYRGSAPGWFANLHTDRKYWAANGRISYTGGRGDFLLDESAVGVSRLGAALNRQIVVTGDARRPVTAGDFTLSIFPTERLTITNNTSVNNTRIDGNSIYSEFNNATAVPTDLNFQFLGIRTITNSTDAQYRATKWLGFFGGYHYSTRLIRSIEDFQQPPGPVTGPRAEQSNHIHSGVAGIRFQPIHSLSFLLEGEVGSADRPFYPVSEKNYHALGARAQYKTKNLTLAAGYRENYNNNSISITAFSSHSRNYSADASWAARSWFTVDAGYSRLHLDTLSGLFFFAGPQQVNSTSLYLSNIHAANLGIRLGIGRRSDLYAGYSITRDAGDGRSSPVAAGADPLSALLAPAQTFPLSFQSPLARVSVRLHSKVRWNAGWQLYRYQENFGLFSASQNYRANTGFTSLMWAF